MESLQMMKYSIRKGRPLNFTQGMRWNDELIEFEFAARMEPVGDAEAYGRSLKDDDDIDEDSDAIMMEHDDVEKGLEELEQQLIDDDDQFDDGNDNDSAYDDMYE
jgi:hypothetical protein